MDSAPNLVRLSGRWAEEILRRSRVDLEFRRRLVADPRAAIREALGHDLPLGLTIQFVERPPNVDALIVLPDFEGQ